MTLDRITIDPAVMEGRACIRGMRITVALVMNLLASGMSRDEIQRNYPAIEDEDIAQCLRYAALLAEESIIPFEIPGLAIPH
jgi:uncharacterized protein (DUF433 family)